MKKEERMEEEEEIVCANSGCGSGLLCFDNKFHCQTTPKMEWDIDLIISVFLHRYPSLFSSLPKENSFVDELC